MARRGCASLSLLLVLAAVIVANGQTTRRSTRQARPKPSATTETLIEAMRNGHVSLQIRSTGASSGDSIFLTVAKTENAPAGTLSITVPPGTILVNKSGTGQSMVVSTVHGRAIDQRSYFPGSEILLTDATPYTYIHTNCVLCRVS